MKLKWKTVKHTKKAMSFGCFSTCKTMRNG